MHSMETRVTSTVPSVGNVLREKIWKVFITRKKFWWLCMVMYVTRHCADHFTTCTNTESSCCTPETNIILYVSFIQIFLEVCATEGTIKKWKDSLQDGRKYVQTIHLIRVQNILKLSQLNSKKRNDSITKWIKDLNRQKKVYR